MTPPRVLITGAAGLLGAALIARWRPHYTLYGACRTRVARGLPVWRGDLADPPAADAVIAAARPALVVHGAAWTDVDGCEADPRRARRINADATGRLAAAARRAGAAFVYVSTDAVFDGRRGQYAETDTPDPVNAYARSKWRGEIEALAAHPGAVVLRVALEGWRPGGPPGFVQWLLEGARAGVTRGVCRDWIRTPIFAPNVADVVDRLWAAGASGIVHAGSAEAASNERLAHVTAEVFALDAAGFVPIDASSLTLRAPRPRDTSLRSDRLRAIAGDVVWDVRTGLTRMRDDERRARSEGDEHGHA